MQVILLVRASRRLVVTGEGAHTILLMVFGLIQGGSRDCIIRYIEVRKLVAPFIHLLS